MVTSVNLRNDVWMDGVAVAGQDLRLQQASAWLTGASPSGSTGIAARPGVRYGTGNPLQVNASSGMNITVNAGVAWVQGTAAANAGMYTGCLDSTATLTVATSDPTNPRIDNVIVQVTDLGTSSSTTVVALQTGTPASSPVAPTLPANSLLLAQIAVAANAASIVAGNITDKRVYTAATGGIVPMANVTGGISGQAGQYAHDLSTGRLKVSDGSGNARQPKTAAFAPAGASAASTTITSSTNYQVILSTSVTVDGITELEVVATWQAISVVTGSPAASDSMASSFSLTGAGPTYSWGTGTNGSLYIFGNGRNQWTGGTFRSWITPSAGTLTIYWVGLLGQATTYMFNAPYLRIQANTQS